MSDFKMLSNVFTVYSLQADGTKFPIIISAILFSVVLLQNSRCQQLDSFYCDTVSMTWAEIYRDLYRRVRKTEKPEMVIQKPILFPFLYEELHGR